MTLRELRQLRNLTTYDITYLTGINNAKVSLGERGYKSFSPKEKAKLGEVLGARVSDIEWDITPDLKPHRVTRVAAGVSNARA